MDLSFLNIDRTYTHSKYYGYFGTNLVYVIIANIFNKIYVGFAFFYTTIIISTYFVVYLLFKEIIIRIKENNPTYNINILKYVYFPIFLLIYSTKSYGMIIRTMENQLITILMMILLIYILLKFKISSDYNFKKMLIIGISFGFAVSLHIENILLIALFIPMLINKNRTIMTRLKCLFVIGISSLFVFLSILLIFCSVSDINIFNIEVSNFFVESWISKFTFIEYTNFFEMLGEIFRFNTLFFWGDHYNFWLNLLYSLIFIILFVFANIFMFKVSFWARSKFEKLSIILFFYIQLLFTILYEINMIERWSQIHFLIIILGMFEFFVLIEKFGKRKIDMDSKLHKKIKSFMKVAFITYIITISSNFNKNIFNKSETIEEFNDFSQDIQGNCVVLFWGYPVNDFGCLNIIFEPYDYEFIDESNIEERIEYYNENNYFIITDQNVESSKIVEKNSTYYSIKNFVTFNSTGLSTTRVYSIKKL